MNPAFENHALDRPRKRVLLGAMAALSCVAVSWWQLQHAFPEPESKLVRRPFVVIGGAGKAQVDKLLGEKAAYFDPSPLFFPTTKNYGQATLPSVMNRQPDEGFRNFPAKFQFSERRLPAYGIEGDPTPERLVDVLSQGNEAPFAGLGKGGPISPPLETRMACVEVKDLKDGRILAQIPLLEARPPKIEFAPLEFLVVVVPLGLVGEPLLTLGSGVESVDEYFRSFVGQSLRVGERFPPGRYLISIGP